jgi:Peptidase_C39 like family
MLGGPLRLRHRREVHPGARPRRWRLALIGGLLVIAVGAACFEPLAPTVLAPLGAPAADVAPAIEQGALVPPAPPLPVPAPPVKLPAPLAAPTMVPLPTTVPTLDAAAQNLLNGIRGDLSARWLKNHAETALRSGPNEQSQLFTMLPQWSTLRVLEARSDWLLVQYSGDGRTREPGPGWVKASDVGGIDPPTVWLSTNRVAPLWGSADAAAARSLDVPGRALMEVIGPETIQGQRVHVRLPGDGRQVPPAQGWIDADALARTGTPSFMQVPRAYPAILAADVRLRVPYRTQLDGAEYESANCGPTTLGMALEAFGLDVAQPMLRNEVLLSEDFSPNDVDAGSYIWALARVAQSRGLKAYGLYESDGQTYHRWTIDDVRANVRAGRPVIVQVVYRGLPGRAESGYDGDHFVVITGLMGEDFIYNDPIGGAPAREAPGWDRVMTPAELGGAMKASDRPYAFTAFGLGRS